MLCRSLRLTSRFSVVLFSLIFLLIGTVAAQTPQSPAPGKAEGDTTPPASATAPVAAESVPDKPAVLPANVVAVADPRASSPAIPAPVSSQTPAPPCKRQINADVVALPHPIMLNRLGASVPDGLVFALKSNAVKSGNTFRLRDEKRPRPIVLRANVGDCLNITLTNSIPTSTFETTKVAGAKTSTTEVSLHIQGMNWVTGSGDDGSFVGANNSSLASAAGSPAPTTPQTQTYKLYAKEEGTFLLYSMGDTSTQGLQLQRGLFGALNVQPRDAEWYRSQVTREDLKLATKKDGSGRPRMTSSGHPILDYNAVYPAGHPLLARPFRKCSTCKCWTQQ